MDELDAVRPAGRRVTMSIALEMDQALTFLNGHYSGGGLPPEFAGLVDGAAAGWQAGWAGVVSKPGHNVDLLEAAASLAGVLLEDDYSRATLAIRECTVEAALAALEQDPLSGSIQLEGNLAAEARVVSLAVRRQARLFEYMGFQSERISALAVGWERELWQVLRVLPGGDLHARFWHWLDGYYYQRYQPWRRTRAGFLVRAEQRLMAVLGAEPSSYQQPGIDWLPQQSPLLRLPELRAGFDAGKLELICWLEPFGLSDAWSLYLPPGAHGPIKLIMSCAEPGQLYENFRTSAVDLASRANALGDPTRLIILRLIRHFGMVNTEIADYLGLARPTVSVHAKILRDAGLIHSQQDGRLVRHEIDAAALRRLFRELAQFLDLPPALAEWSPAQELDRAPGAK